MNYMQKWKAGWTDPDQKIKYRKAYKEEIDNLVFLSRVISVIAEDNCTEFVFLESDLETFISVKYYNDGSVYVGKWTNKNSPYVYVLRNENGQFQSLREAGNDQ